MTSARLSVRVDPSAESWRALIEQRWGAIDASAKAFRAELGLPTDRPIVMSGHQAAFWHAGILSKVFAADAAARTANGIAAWIVVDSDEAEFAIVRAPVRDGRNLLGVQELKLCDTPAAGVAAASLPTFEPKALRPTGGPFALPSVSWGTASITESLLSRRGEATAARQVAQASFDLLDSHVGRPTALFATALAGTALFREFLARMMENPAAAASTYNAAIAKVPEAGLTPLSTEPSRNHWELPLWRLEQARPRKRVWSDELSASSMGLAPRALLLTGMLRMAACDLFIHGTGGALYDRATEAWLGEWLGATLAPTAIVTADLLLPFDESSITPAEVARATWRAHHARHDPALVGRDDLAPKKRAMVEAIRAARERGENALPLYLEMHRVLATFRDQERSRLADLKSEAERVADRFASAKIANDRTWPFPFHRSESIAALRDEIGAVFGAPAAAQKK